MACVLALLTALAPMPATAEGAATGTAAADCAINHPLMNSAAGAQSSPSAPTPRTTRQAERYINASEALAQVDDPSTVIVDLRRDDEIADLRIPNALAIPAHQVKTKGFLRGKRLLLIDAGHRYGTLERTVAELAGTGFPDVRIIEGGLNAWRAAGGQLLGPASPSRLRRVRPMELAGETAFDHWRVMLLGDQAGDGKALPAGASPATPTLPAAVLRTTQLLGGPTATLDVDTLQLDAVRATLAHPAQDTLRPLILLVDEDGRQAERLLSRLGDAAPWNLFMLEGGLQGWRSAERQLVAMQARRLAPPLPKGACGG